MVDSECDWLAVLLTGCCLFSIMPKTTCFRRPDSAELETVWPLTGEFNNTEKSQREKLQQSVAV